MEKRYRKVLDKLDEFADSNPEFRKEIYSAALGFLEMGLGIGVNHSPPKEAEDTGEIKDYLKGKIDDS